MAVSEPEAVAADRDDYTDLDFTYLPVQPNRWTFQSDKIRRWVERRLEGRVLNACAGKTHLTHTAEVVRNDIDPERDADLHLDVCEIAVELEAESFGTIVYDPPFTANQATRTYDGREVGDDRLAKEQFHELLEPGGVVIQFGYTTTCMPMEWDYRREAVACFNTLGRMNDYLAAVDRKPGEPPEDTGWF